MPVSQIVRQSHEGHKLLLTQAVPSDLSYNCTFENFLTEFFLTHSSIKQFPGPISLLKISFGLLNCLTIVALDIPPIFKKQTGKSILFCEDIN